MDRQRAKIERVELDVAGIQVGVQYLPGKLILNGQEFDATCCGEESSIKVSGEAGMDRQSFEQGIRAGLGLGWLMSKAGLQPPVGEINGDDDEPINFGGASW